MDFRIVKNVKIHPKNGKKVVADVEIFPPNMDNYFEPDPTPVFLFSYPLMTEYHVIQ